MCCGETISKIDEKICVDCKTSKTPLWRSGPSGPKCVLQSLCNACGISYRKKKSISGSEKKKEEEKKREKQPPSSPTSSSSCCLTMGEDDSDLRRIKLVVLLQSRRERE
ncbi:hypothetical protein Ccrd_002249, partial [Cynara cardunculus var. scolymus]